MIYTIGYTGWKPARLLSIANDLGASVVDVRLRARSRSFVWNYGQLTKLLGSRYYHVPTLGNRNYQSGGPIELARPAEGLRQVLPLMQRGPVVLLCACADWQHCHRTTVAALLSEQTGHQQVEHISANGIEQAALFSI